MGKRSNPTQIPSLIHAKNDELDDISSKRQKLDTTIESLAHTLLSIQSDSFDHSLPLAHDKNGPSQRLRAQSYVSDDDESESPSLTLSSRSNKSKAFVNTHSLLRCALPCPPRLAGRMVESLPTVGGESAPMQLLSPLPPGRPLPPRPSLPSGIVAINSHSVVTKQTT